MTNRQRTAVVVTAGARNVLRTALIVRGAQGFVAGLALYIWGPLFYERLVHVTTPAAAVSFTSVLFGAEFFLVALFEVPTGAYADAVGRKWSVVWSWLCRTLNLLCLACVPLATSLSMTLALGALAVVTFALAYTFFSGSFTAWCVDQLRTTAPEVPYDRILAPAQTANSLLMFVGALVGIVAYVQGLTTGAFLLGAFVACGCLIYCLGEMEEAALAASRPPRGASLLAATPAEMGRVVSVGVRALQRSPALLALVTIYAGFMTLNNFVTLLWPIYVRSHLPAGTQVLVWIFLAATMQLTESAGAALLARWASRRARSIRAHNATLRRVLLWACLSSGVAILSLSRLVALGYDQLWLVASAVGLVGLACGALMPAFETLINNYIPDSHAQTRSTILSMASLLKGLLIVVLAMPTSGPNGPQTIIGWAVPAALLLCIAMIGHVVLRREQTRAPALSSVRK